MHGISKLMSHCTDVSVCNAPFLIYDTTQPEAAFLFFVKMWCPVDYSLLSFPFALSGVGRLVLYGVRFDIDSSCGAGGAAGLVRFVPVGRPLRR